ncbi:hypothetical protein [Nocardia sp. R6R-6]|uniref:hypothetical protein n=1 Tax=Nocardia sp. R6R-6 TaxID=3459303 RepID=UPI00403D85B2
MTDLPRAVPGVTVTARIIGSCGFFAKIVADFEPPGTPGETEIFCTAPDEQIPVEYLPAVADGLREGLGAVAAAVLITGGAFHQDCKGCRVRAKVNLSGVRNTVRRMRIGYGWVSTRDQHPEAQHDALTARAHCPTRSGRPSLTDRSQPR